MIPVLILAALLCVCHFLADYCKPFVKSDMLSAKRIGSPLEPIWVHAMMHFYLMVIAIGGFMFVYNPTNMDATGRAMVALFLQMLSHFGIDVLKGKMNVWFPKVSNPANPSHWVIFGLDQLLHHIVILVMVAIIFWRY